ncbi:DUF6502 family protein [Cochlodiniinecator piscidefendens]|uniref:DUF6502 family protein n=1 Tax=Cochlodiniinecator piscidefendens TaxID=2715756 RepID=UPI00140A7ADE|nr:DUF6502 family protein [Cochlodiniinecator piscidefendens]
MTKPTDPFEAALAALLGPLAQAMVAHGVTIGTATEALKNALLHAALATSETTINDSRASLMTGIHRKDIKRLRNLDDGSMLRRSSNATASVISHWATDPEFQDDEGEPLTLRRNENSAAPSFDSLVRKARIDMAPGTVLRALLDQEVVTELADGSYKLLTHAFLPKAGSDAQVAAYHATLSAHLAASTHNLLSDEDTGRFFDRAVRYSHLSEASVNALNATASKKAQELLQDINALARDMQKIDVDKDENGKFVLGAYILPTLPGSKED